MTREARMSCWNLHEGPGAYYEAQMAFQDEANWKSPSGKPPRKEVLLGNAAETPPPRRHHPLQALSNARPGQVTKPSKDGLEAKPHRGGVKKENWLTDLQYKVPVFKEKPTWSASN